MFLVRALSAVARVTCPAYLTLTGIPSAACSNVATGPSWWLQLTAARRIAWHTGYSGHTIHIRCGHLTGTETECS
eukprot:scaffold5513_cov202-Prasinococcus_capsulatus_cf.AAC.2